MKPLKIGILINLNRELLDYEARIFSAILNDSRYEVVCIIKDARKLSAMAAIFKKFNNPQFQGTSYNPLLFWILDIFERQLLKRKKIAFFDKSEVTAKISALPCIEISPQKKGLHDVFSREDCVKLEKLNLDVLLKHAFRIIKGEILKVPNYGIWSLQPGDTKVNRGEPGGFWEVYNNNSVTGATLLLLEDKIDGGKVIDKGFYNTEKFWYLNFENALDCSVDIILKNLRLLYERRELNTLPSGVYSNKRYLSPTFLQTCNYIFHTYSSIAFRELSKKFYNALDITSAKDVWKLHIGKDDIWNAELWQTKTIEPPVNEFWADPFLLHYDDKIYVFFENWEYSRNKGKISVGIIHEDQITNVSDCIDVNYHLSYPFVFEYNKQVFMIPETGQMKRLEIWRCDHFPNKWSLNKTCFEQVGRSLVDSTIVKDTNNQYWLFVNFGSEEFRDHGSNLSVFKIDSPMMNEIIPHKLNPVVTDCRSARNAGNIYIDNKGRLIRPSQASQNGIYGECLNLCHVKELTIDTYQEEILETITPEFKDGLFSVHHLSQTGDIFVLDGCYKNR
ncbi:MAG: hypothetical protein H0V39_04460 [Nitrosomonas sp.]|nr:hypothetical protein [Nitrosomonas sp.]